MTGIFSDITLSWDGKEFVIPFRRVLGAIAVIEEVITLQELSAFAARGTAPMAKLSMAYAAVLRYAGAVASDAEVYQAMVHGGEGGNVSSAISTLLAMMVPKTKVAPGDASKGNVPPAAANSSKKRMRSRSGSAG